MIISLIIKKYQVFCNGNGYSLSNGFCIVEDDNKKQYILTDKNKQPLYCLSNYDEQLLAPGTLINGTCKKDNYKKYLDNPALTNGKSGENFFLNEVAEDQFIPCSSYNKKPRFGQTNSKPDNSLPNVSLPIPKSNINFNNYDIASFVNIQNTNSEPINPKVIDIIKGWDNYFQKSLIKEDTRKVDPNAPAPAPAPEPESINNKLFKIIAFIEFLLLLALIFRKRKK